jgi:dTDP-4-dehydrorhamnose reductase
MKVFIFGSNGMLGTYLVNYLKNVFEVVPITRSDVDLNDDFSLITNKYHFDHTDIIINSAGVIKQRNFKHSELIKVNSLFPHFLSTIGCNVIHITTDCVFSGKIGSYDEDSLHDCLDDYGKSKSLGECYDLTTIRTSIIGEEIYNKKSLVEWVKSSKNSKISGYLNHFWNGVTCLELSKQIEIIINSNQYWKGVRHYHSPNTVSKYELVSCINKIYELNNIVNPVMAEYCDRSLKTIYDRPIKKSIEDQILEMKEFNILKNDK